MDLIKFFAPPVLTSVTSIYLISSRKSKKESLLVGASCLAVVAAGSYYACSRNRAGKRVEPELPPDMSDLAEFVSEMSVAKNKQSIIQQSALPEENREDLDKIHAEQQSIQTQIQCSIMTSITFMSTAYYGLSVNSETNAFSLCGRSLSIPGLVLAFAVLNVGSRRYPDEKRSKEVTDGGKISSEMRIHASFLQNTLEQLSLHVIASLAIASTVSKDSLQLVPALSALWTIGRALYFTSYLHDPVMRAYGFGLTIMPSFGALLACSALNIRRYFQN